mmetsp:Transcript_6782/g.17291  ORF Transcript_6782/g.17291 Transcript_6782/m.17291 type:complete len:221 (-) Transcript_6782:2425-3087(-)
MRRGVSDNDNPWDQLGRGSSAGRALFSLYSGDLQGRAAGNKYSQTNRAKFIKQLQNVNRTIVPEEKKIQTPKSRAKVSIPRPAGKSKKAVRMEVPKLGKKPANKIQEDLFVLEEEIKRDIPQPTRSLIGDEEKERYARLLEWNGNPPPTVVRAKPKKAERTERNDLEDLFDGTMREIEERKDFLDEMRAAGRGAAFENQIKAEIQTVSCLLQLQKSRKEL